MANTLAYYDTATITAVKIFIVQAAVQKILKTFVPNNLKMLAPGGIEPTTFALLARRSNQLSYGALDINL